MLLQSEADLVALLGVAAFILLALAIIGGVIASLKSFQVRQFQELLFKAERKIDTLERRMFNVLNAVPVALVETDATGKFTFANKAAHQLLGRKDSELIGLRFHSATWGITYPDGRTIPPDMLPTARTLRGQTVKGFQHLLTNHGSFEKVLVSVTAMPIENSNGEVIGSTSALVELETASGEGVDDLTGLWRGHWFAAATVPFWGLDAGGRILDINNAALDAFDLKREAVLGKSWAEVFVSDADYQAALDYLGDTQDSHQPHDTPSVTLQMVAHNAKAPALVTAWVVRTHEGGEPGLTVMALPALTEMVAPVIGAEPFATSQADMAQTLLDDDDAQELADHRQAEAARAALGVGVWQYDSEADTIVEDAGMQALIGRQYVGGPTLISESDQTLADAAFAQLMAGETDHLALDIRVIEPTGEERWITLKGQAKPSVEGQPREIFGVAFDCTEWKHAADTAQFNTILSPAMANIPTDPQLIETGISEADLEAAVQKATDDARTAAQLELEAALISAREDARLSVLAEVENRPVAGVPPETVTIHEPDPKILAENEALKARIEALKTDLAETEAHVQSLTDAHTQALAQGQVAPAEPLSVEPDPVVVAENQALKARIEALEKDLAQTEAHVQSLTDVHTQALADMQIAPSEPLPVEPNPAVAAENQALKARLEKLEIDLATSQSDYNDLQLLLMAKPVAIEDVIAPDATELNALKVERDTAEAARQALAADLEAAQKEQAALKLEVEALVNAPTPVPDYSAHETREAKLLADLEVARDTLARLLKEHEAANARYEQLLATPAYEPDYSEWEGKLAAAQFDIAKWQAAYHDAQEKLQSAKAAEAAEADQAALETRLKDLQDSLAQSQAQQTDMQARLDQLNAALNNAQRYETVGRLTGDVAQDFAQMLNVINGALEVMTKQDSSPEGIKRLAEAALAAGKRGERLTRQLQAFQSEEF